MVQNGDNFVGYFMSTEIVNRMFNVLIYGWLNEVAASVSD